MLKKFLVLCAAGCLILGTPVFAADKAAAEQAISDAKAASEVAKAAGGEWRDTGKILKDAEKALEGGEFDEAVKLAGKAKFQYEAAAAQAESQAGLGNPGYLK
jgi:hypothetical protein